MQIDLSTTIGILTMTGLVSALVAAAVSDLRTYTIPNWCSVVILALYPLAALLTLNDTTMGDNIVVFLIVLGIGYGLFAVNMMGAGDVKLLAAIGLWAGTEAIVDTIFVVCLACIVLVTLLVVTRHALKWAAATVPALHDAQYPRLLQIGANVPMGVAIVLGTLITLPLNPTVQALF